MPPPWFTRSLEAWLHIMLTLGLKPADALASLTALRFPSRLTVLIGCVSAYAMRRDHRTSNPPKPGHLLFRRKLRCGIAIGHVNCVSQGFNDLVEYPAVLGQVGIRDIFVWQRSHAIHTP